MINQELLEYIKKARDQNIADEKIRSTLQAEDWSDEDIIQAFTNTPSVITIPVPKAPLKIQSGHSMWDAFEQRQLD